VIIALTITNKRAYSQIDSLNIANSKNYSENSLDISNSKIYSQTDSPNIANSKTYSEDNINIANAKTYTEDSLKISKESWSLHDCMEYGVVHSLKIKIKSLNNKDTHIDKKEAGLDFLPSVVANINTTSSWGRSVNPETNTYDNINILNNYYSLTASLTVFNGFKIINNYKVAKIAEKIGISEKQLLKDNLCIDIAKSFSNVVFKKGMIEIMENTLKNSKEDLVRTQLMKKLGLKTETDIVEMQAQYLSDTLNYIKAKNEFEKAELNLKALINLPSDQELIITKDILIKKGTKVDIPTALNKELRFLNAKKEVMISKLKLRTAKWQIWPQIEIQGGYNTNYIYNPDALKNDGYWNQLDNQAGQYIQVSVSSPVFNARYKAHQKIKQKNAYHVAEYQKAVIKREVTDEIIQAVNDMKAAKAEYLMSVKKAKARIKAHNVNRKKYAEGLINVLDLNKSAILEAQARAELLNMLLTYNLKNMIVLYYQGISYLDQ